MGNAPDTGIGRATVCTLGCVRVRCREIATSVAALAGLYLIAGVYLRPIWRLWRTHIAPNQEDPLFNLYLLKWVGHEAGEGFRGFWDAPFFYPAKGVLAWSDHLLGPGLVATTWNKIIPGWVGAYNLLFISSFALTGWSMGWMLRRSGRSFRASFLGAVLYAFCPFHWDQVPHIQVLLMAAIPVTLWSFDRLLRSPSWVRAAGFLLCYAFHLSGGCYLAFMIHVPLLVLACNRLPELRTHLSRRVDLAVLASVFVAAAVMLTAIFWQYWRTGGGESLAWTAAAQRHWGASLLSFLQPSPLNLYGSFWPTGLFRSENCLFPGWVAAALCVTGIVLFLRNTPLSRQNPALLLAQPSLRGLRLLPLALAILGWTGGELRTWSEKPGFSVLARWSVGHGYELPLALVVAGTTGWAALHRRERGRWPWSRISALGSWPRGLLLAGIATALLSTPLFYLPLSRLLPGFSAMRVPARFQAFTMVTVAFFASAAFDALAARLRAAGASDEDRTGAAIGNRRARRRATLLTAALFAAALVEVAPQALPWEPLVEEADFPPVYAWVADQPDIHAMIELPLNDSKMAWLGPASLQAMYFGTRHWRPLVNGFSAHFPQAYERLEATCCYPMPDAATLAGLASWGVTHILIHRHKLPLWQRRALDEWTDANDAEMVYAGGGDRVYRLPSPAR